MRKRRPQEWFDNKTSWADPFPYMFPDARMERVGFTDVPRESEGMREPRMLQREEDVFLVARALTYATLFIGLVLIFLPAPIVAAWGIVRPAPVGPWQAFGLLLGIAGAVLALSCVLAFVTIGKGTPAPFDPPRRLVVQGPYRRVRNPMYIGAGLALVGAAIFYQSPALLGYLGLLCLITHIFVVAYEEPTLRRTFGADYEDYCRRTARWLPRASKRPEPKEEK